MLKWREREKEQKREQSLKIDLRIGNSALRERKYTFVVVALRLTVHKKVVKELYH
jgi:hypothetical protein